MNLDVFTLSALVDEFMDVLVGGRVQDTLAVDETGVGLEIYGAHKRRYLYISADHHTPRVHLVPDKLRRGMEKPSQIGLMLRRYVEGGIVTHVSQPAWERILHIDVEGSEGTLTLIVEPMERRSNLLLVQNGIILDCIRRVGADENRYRVSLPAHPYMPPPPQTGKRDPFTISEEDLAAALSAGDDPKRKGQQALSAGILGISPLLGKEILYRAGYEPNVKAVEVDAAKVFPAFQQVIEPLRAREWQPGVAETEQDGVTAFSVYPLRSIAGWHSTESVSEALSAFYGAPVGAEAYKAGKEPVMAALNEARDKLRGKLASLQRSMTDDAERETWRQSGELILAYQYNLQKGETELRAQYDPDAPELVIKLDPTMTPLENAQRYFDRYNRAKRALDDVPTLINETQNELAYLDQLATDLDLAANWNEIYDVQNALQAKGHWRGQTVRRGGQQSGPLRLVSKDGFVIWVGRNSRQNEVVTFDKGGGLDLWLHARDVPGAHVVIRFDGRPIPEALIEQAAAVAAYYSAKRDEGKVIVDVTQCKYVKKIKGAGPGMVTYRNETTRTVAPRDKDILE